MNEAIVKAVAEATRAAIQTMVESHQRQEDKGPKLGSPALKQPQFNWEVADKYREWKAFVLEIRNVICNYNAHEQETIAMVKNWLGRKGLHYIESLTEVEKWVCGNLQGLIDTIAKKFRPQYNETIKTLQFRQLCRHEGENAEEWMGRLQVAVAECNYKEIDCQLKEQFIHGDKTMLDEVIRELTTKSINDQMTSEDVLIWVKRVEAQRMQAAILRDITDSQKFNRVNMAKKQASHKASPNRLCRYCGSSHAPRQCLAYGKTSTGCRKMGHFKKVCQSRKDHEVHEVGVKMSQEEDEREEESINSVYLNNKWLLITTQLEMQVSNNALKVPYKIDTGSEGNLMWLYIFKKLCGNRSVEQLKRSIKSNIKLKTYNGMQIEQLGTCMATIKFKNFKKI